MCWAAQRTARQQTIRQLRHRNAAAITGIALTATPPIRPRSITGIADINNTNELRVASCRTKDCGAAGLEFPAPRAST
jgi:hypothetical protein